MTRRGQANPFRWVKSKRNLALVKLLIACICMTFFLTSCYLPIGIRSSGRSDLFAVACYSVPLLTTNWDFDQVTVIEEDKYGRVMYRYTSYTNHALDEYNGDHICALLICQKSDRKYAYYYENYSFIISTGEDAFTDSDVQQLKSLNDWGIELAGEKLSKVANSFELYGDLTYFEHRKAFDVVKNYLKLQTSTAYFADIIAEDADNKIFFALREYAKSAKGYVFGKTYFVISDKDFNIDSENSIMIVDDIINCQQAMQLFKLRNNWHSLK
jgi:hypothetical protein